MDRVEENTGFEVGSKSDGPEAKWHGNVEGRVWRVAAGEALPHVVLRGLIALHDKAATALAT